jgi:cytochrome c nitrite reductase small subunit
LNKPQFLTGSALLVFVLGAAAAALGLVVAGAGLAYADKASFCGSCHSMQFVYQTWNASGHKQFTCGDCHLPQENLGYKLYVKGENGVRHVYHEVLRDYPENIKVTPMAKAIASQNCLRCHATTVENTFMSAGGQNCITCHKGIVHGQNVIKGGVPVE